jgi:hypothetical protein
MGSAELLEWHFSVLPTTWCLFTPQLSQQLARKAAGNTEKYISLYHCTLRYTSRGPFFHYHTEMY